MDLRDKDIAFFLDLEIPSDSEVSFCASDDIEDDNFEFTKPVPNSLDDIDEILVTSYEIEQFHKEVHEELRLLDQGIASTSQYPVENVSQTPSNTFFSKYIQFKYYKMYETLLSYQYLFLGIDSSKRLSRNLKKHNYKSTTKHVPLPTSTNSAGNNIIIL